MAFTGDLEHLPIVDVIQLMNSTRKSGVLSVRGRKGESQLVFKEGYIVSANHLNNSVRIGQVLVEMGFVSDSQIQEGLARQQLDGENRRPLAITLMEIGSLNESHAYKALQHLIEITVVEILTWKTGKFTLEQLKDVIECDFRYYPERMDHEINVNTQGILMDALRIFDEKKRDGLIVDEPEEPEAAGPDELISEDDLGLSEIDNFNPKIPIVFTTSAPFDPVESQRRRIAEISSGLTVDEQEKLVLKLAQYTTEHTSEPKPGAIQVHVALADRILSHSVITWLTGAGFAVISAESLTATSGDVVLLTDGSAVQGFFNVLFCPAGNVEAIFAAYRGGAEVVMPQPSGASYVDEILGLLELLPEFLQRQR